MTCSTQKIGLMAELTGTSNLEPMVRAARQRLADAGLETVVVSSGPDQQSELEAWNILVREGCDGFIVYSDTLSNDQLARIKSTRKNTVLANINHMLAGKLAANLIVKLGHLNVAVITGPDERYSITERNQGFLNHVNSISSQDACVRSIPVREISVQAGRSAMSRLLELDNRPSAVFFHHERLADGGMQVCKENRILIPDDLSLVTMCESEWTGFGEKGSVCMVRQPLPAIGRFAADRLIEQLGNASDKGYKPNATWPSPYIEYYNSLKERRAEEVSRSKPPTRISKREQECLQWVAKGKTSWEISQILGVTESTVIYHLRNATRKLNAANRMHAVTKALKASIIDL